MNTLLNINEIKNFDFLTTFLNLFGAKIKSYKIENNFINGLIYWEDDDIDDEPEAFNWPLSYNQELLKNATKILKYISTSKLHRNDKIIISEHDLRQVIKDNIDDASRINEVFDFIFDQEVLLFDDGINTHSFFLHL